MQKIPKNSRPSFIGMDATDLESIISEHGERLFRAQQLFNWIYKQRVQSFSEMVNLPQLLVADISKRYLLNPLKIIKVTGEKSDSTRKYLLECEDGEKIESVLMKYDKRITICISSQVGCALACEFCATGTMGIKRNLTAGEIVAQYLLLANESEEPITNVVFMGMGEPFLNYENVIKAANLLNNPKGINLGIRHITISTAGIIPRIIQFSDEKQRYNLAISLNGTTQEQRLATMPITKKYPLDELIESARYYFNETNNFITFEYVLLSGLNDSFEDAQRLIKLLSDLPCKLNIIPYNEIGSEYNRPSDDKIQNFIDNLSDAPFTMTTRWSKGSHINAGCGQLVVSE